jgi:nucleoid-associated protein YgaU
MGLFSFVKEAGAKLFGIGETQAAKVEREQVKAEALLSQVKAFGLASDDLRIEVADEVATVYGTVSSQAEKEKIVLLVGNVNGIGQVDDRLEVVTPQPPAAFYTVVPGDTLSKIAKQHYGNAMKYPVIFEANQPMLKHPDKIYPGQVLRIPPLE